MAFLFSDKVQVLVSFSAFFDFLCGSPEWKNERDDMFPSFENKHLV